MKKIALIMGLAGCFSLASADMTRTFDMTIEDNCPDEDYGPCMVYEFPDDLKTSFPAASGGFGKGYVLKKSFVLNGMYASAGVGFVFNEEWDNAPIDATKMTAVTISLRTDMERTVEISLKNTLDAEYDVFSKAGVSYMVSKKTDATGATFTIPVASFVFPTWWNKTPDDAGDAKDLSQAWVGSKLAADMKAKRELVLKSLTGIQVGIPCEQADQTCTKDAGWVEIDNVTIVGVKDAEGLDWWDVEQSEGVMTRSSRTQSLRAVINGQNLLVARTGTGSASLELVRLDGSRVGSWAISGSKATIALPTSLEKGTYFAVMSSAGQRSSVTVSVVR